MIGLLNGVVVMRFIYKFFAVSALVMGCGPLAAGPTFKVKAKLPDSKPNVVEIHVKEEGSSNRGRNISNVKCGSKSIELTLPFASGASPFKPHSFSDIPTLMHGLDAHLKRISGEKIKYSTSFCARLQASCPHSDLPCCKAGTKASRRASPLYMPERAGSPSFLRATGGLPADLDLAGATDSENE